MDTGISGTTQDQLRQREPEPLPVGHVPFKAGKIPYRKTGNRHLVPAAALREFKVDRDHQLDQLDRLAVAEQDLGLR